VRHPRRHQPATHSGIQCREVTHFLRRVQVPVCRWPGTCGDMSEHCLRTLQMEMWAYLGHVRVRTSQFGEDFAAEKHTRGACTTTTIQRLATAFKAPIARVCFQSVCIYACCPARCTLHAARNAQWDTPIRNPSNLFFSRNKKQCKLVRKMLRTRVRLTC
jgi:hypothetical protein